MTVIHYDRDADWIDRLTENYALKKERPRQNTIFLLFLAVAGVALLIAMPIMAWQSLVQRDNCECHVPGTTLPSGTYIPPEHEKCMTDMDYNFCYTSKTNDWAMFSGLAGMGAGLLILSALGLRYL